MLNNDIVVRIWHMCRGKATYIQGRPGNIMSTGFTVSSICIMLRASSYKYGDSAKFNTQ
jgi:hypothetical protein